jgi:predicted nucleic acid-binding Zn ribbon protein
MERRHTQSIADILAEVMRDNGLEKPLMEHQVVDSWGDVMGKTVSRMTRKVELEQGVLRVYLSSAALKAHLFECRHELVKKLNEHVGGEVVKDIRLLG